MSPKQKQLNIRINEDLEKEVDKVTNMFNKYSTIKASKSSIIEAAIKYGIDKLAQDARRMDELYYFKERLKDYFNPDFVLTETYRYYKGNVKPIDEILRADTRAIETLEKLENCDDEADKQTTEYVVRQIGIWNMKTDDYELQRAMNGCSYKYLIYLIRTKFLV